MEKFEFRKYLYYGLIIIVSIITLVFMPMMGSSIGLGFNFPDTAAGWVIYVVTRIAVAGLNLLIFYCFMEQAKINIKDNAKYKEANDILERGDPGRKYQPRSPRAWTNRQYGGKGVMIVFGSLVSALVLTNAILTYDWIVFLTYFVTVLMGVIMGIIQMRSAEFYWTNEYWQYAQAVKAGEIKKPENKTKAKKGSLSHENMKSNKILDKTQKMAKTSDKKAKGDNNDSN